MIVIDQIRNGKFLFKIYRKLRKRDSLRIKRRSKKLQAKLQIQAEAELSKNLLDIHRAASFWNSMNKELEIFTSTLEGNTRLVVTKLNIMVKELAKVISDIQNNPSQIKDDIRTHQKNVLRLQKKYDSSLVTLDKLGSMRRNMITLQNGETPQKDKNASI